MKKKRYPTVLTIAGSDSSGGAGVQGDIKAISANGCYAAAVITALTAQNTQGVNGIQRISSDFIRLQLEAVFSDIKIDAVKIGMLHDKETIEAVVGLIEKFKPCNVVVDPVMVAKGGAQLLNGSAIHVLKERLFPLATIITPNIPEAKKITGIDIVLDSDMEGVAKYIGERYKTSVLVKGGHLCVKISSDVLFNYSDRKFYWFRAKRIDTKNTHGTGCALSSSIASFLAKGHTLEQSTKKAKKYLSKAISQGKGFGLGGGHGPINHFNISPSQSCFIKTSQGSM